MLPPSPHPSCLGPAPVSFLGPSRPENQWPPKPKRNLIPLSPVLGSAEEQRAGPSGGVGRSASPHPPWHRPGPQGTRPKSHLFVLHGLWPVFIVSIVSGFVLRNKKHFHIIFTFMIKPSTRQSSSLVTHGVWPLLTPASLLSSQVAGDRPAGVGGVGGVGGRAGKREAGALSLS